jgi:hypothetical protein
MRMGKDRGQSLNDVLGDIPMSRVKSYSIKDTKNGKRIVIDLENGPLVEQENKIIVIREPGRHYGHGGPRHQVKVIRHSNGGEMQEEITAPEDAPPPPPPPPAPDKKQEKSKGNSPKI